MIVEERRVLGKRERERAKDMHGEGGLLMGEA